MERKLFAYANITSILVVGISMIVYTSYFEDLPWHHMIEGNVQVLFMAFIPVLLISGETIIMLKNKLSLDNINPSLPFISIPLIILPVFFDRNMGDVTTGLGSIFSMIMLVVIAVSFMINVRIIRYGKKDKMYKMKK